MDLLCGMFRTVRRVVLCLLRLSAATFRRLAGGALRETSALASGIDVSAVRSRSPHLQERFALLVLKWIHRWHLKVSRWRRSERNTERFGFLVAKLWHRQHLRAFNNIEAYAFFLRSQNNEAPRVFAVNMPPAMKRNAARCDVLVAKSAERNILRFGLLVAKLCRRRQGRALDNAVA